jgi:hypothetical protein
MNLYAGSDGRYYTDWQVSWRFENDEWRPCMWDTEEGWELVEEDNELVRIDPVEETELPDWAELAPEGHGVVVVDRRDDRVRDRLEPSVGGGIG